jgi:hypothetical protein
MEYKIKVIKVSPTKSSLDDRIMDYNRYDQDLFEANMTSDEVVEILNHLWQLRSRAERG